MDAPEPSEYITLSFSTYLSPERIQQLRTLTQWHNDWRRANDDTAPDLDMLHYLSASIGLWIRDEYERQRQNHPINEVQQ